MTENNTLARPSRRAVTLAAGWAAPTIVMAAKAPAFAASPSLNNALQGYVSVGTDYNKQGRVQATFDGDRSQGTVNGIPYGLYVDIEDGGTATYSDAFIEIDMLGNFAAGTDNSQLSYSGMPASWSSVSRTGTVTRNDDGTNRTYTRFRFSYSGTFTREGDRTWLQDFYARTNYHNEPNAGGTTYWFRRFVKVNGQQRFFERRNGDLGFIDYYGGGAGFAQRSAAPQKQVV